MREKALNLLGLMRKANALRIGEEDTGSAMREHAAKLVIVASDASDNARKRATGYMHAGKAPLITLPFTKEEISAHVGKSGCSMAAICDIGFADAFMKLLCGISPTEYEDAAQTIQRRAQISKKRKNDSTQQKNKRTGKRRTSA